MRSRVTARFVLKAIILVFVAAVSCLAVIGVIVALGNDRVGIAIALAFLAPGIAIGALLAGLDVLRRHDDEAYEFRRYD